MTIRSFTTRPGRITERQKRALENAWPLYGLSSEQGQGPLLALAESYERVVLEIGFGMGHTLLTKALSEPTTLFIGIEVYGAGVGSLLADVQEANIDNVRIFKEDAVHVLRQMVPDFLDAVWLYFPDPWPKKRHHKRRIVQNDFVKTIHRVLKIGGVWHLATDWQEYAQHMLVTIERSNAFQNKAGLGHFSERPLCRPVTKFESRGQRLGHEVFDLLFEKIGLDESRQIDDAKPYENEQSPFWNTQPCESPIHLGTIS